MQSSLDNKPELPKAVISLEYQRGELNGWRPGTWMTPGAWFVAACGIASCGWVLAPLVLLRLLRSSLSY
jgi:hypothetical protein